MAPQSLPGDDGRVRDPSESSHLRQAAQPGGSAAGMAVIEITKQTFYCDVVQRSHATLVILYLCAKWCRPCHQLGPVLEKLAAESGGHWVLAKVDIDANPQLKAALQVQRIPMVAAVADGQLVDGFFGAMPETPLRQWLGQVPAAAEKRGPLKVTTGVDWVRARARERRQQVRARERQLEDLTARNAALLREVNPPDPDSWR
jgi:thioredoxin-like negative regulator of GroEL